MKTGIIVAVVLGVIIVALLAVVLFYPPTTHAPVMAPTPLPVASSSTPPGGLGGLVPLVPITQADNGSTVHLAQGQQIELQFSSGLSWRFVFDPAGVITASSGGLYTAAAAGTTVLRATGAPICNPGQACPQFLEEITIAFVVQ